MSRRMKYRDYLDESDFDFDVDTESDAGESEVAWAQCDSCDKWRQHNMKDPNGKFQCEMVGNGVSCATPEDEDEDPSAGKNACKDIIHDAGASRQRLRPAPLPLLLLNPKHPSEEAAQGSINWAAKTAQKPWAWWSRSDMPEGATGP